ncbi:MAG: HEAT repeat domain-containing protein [Anaerolineales bacterium]|nr:HEAT repeat domain-containing protein [Anaerolineales bacterium]
MSFLQDLFKPNVEKLKATHDVKGLIKALDYKKDASIREDAIEALVAILGYDDIREEVANALVKIGAPATEPLVTALQDGNVNVRNAAISVLEKTGWQPSKDESSAIYWIAKREWNECIEIGSPAIEPLITALKYEIGDRDGVAEALSKIGNPAIEPLIAELQDGLIREGVVDVLAKIGIPAVKPLGAALKNGRRNVKLSVIKVLSEIADSRSVELLIESLRDEDISVRLDAINALGKIGDPRALDALISMLKDMEVGIATIEALGKIGDTRAVEPLIRELRFHESDAADALVNIGAPALEALLAALHSEFNRVRAVAAQVLGRIGDARAVKPLIFALEDGDPNVRISVINALAEIGEISAVEALAAESKHVTGNLKLSFNSPVRLAALRALIKIGDPLVIERLVNALKDSDNDVKLWAINTLGEIGDSRAVEPLMEKFKKDDFRDVALKSLAKIGSPSVKPLIIELYTEKLYRSRTRQMVANALVEIYHQQGLDEQTKADILLQREAITAKHCDSHTDETCDGLGFVDPHTDDHTDMGIGVDFPL